MFGNNKIYGGNLSQIELAVVRTRDRLKRHLKMLSGAYDP